MSLSAPVVLAPPLPELLPFRRQEQRLRQPGLRREPSGSSVEHPSVIQRQSGIRRETGQEKTD
jgi:hypothetical protein